MDIIWPGTPGERWTNETDRVAFFFQCSFVNSCPECMLLHTAISFEPFPIPMHDNCGCWQVDVMPEMESEPFVHYDDYLKRLTDDEKERSIGMSLWKLIKKGVVAWEDVVTPERIRTLAEVVKAKHLTADEMVEAGVSRSVAERAVNWSKADVAEIIKNQRDELTRKISEAAKWAAELRRAIAAGVGGIKLIGAEHVSGWPRQGAHQPQRPAASHIELPSKGTPEAKLLDEFLKKWPNVSKEAIIAFLIAEDAERKKKLQAK